MKSSKRLLIIFPTEYYLFNYVYRFAQDATSFFSEVEVLTLDKFVLNKFSESNVKASFFPKMLIFAYKLSDYIILRGFTWICFRAFYFLRRNDFDVVFLPWDNKLIFISALAYFKSVTSHCTFNLVNIKDDIEQDKSMKKSPFIDFFEKILNKDLSPKLQGVTLKHNYYWYFDKIFGMKSLSHVQGFSGVDLMTVTGIKIMDNVLNAGISSLDVKIEVTGNPNYEGILEEADKLKKAGFDELYDNLSIEKDQDVFTLFLSPVSFSKDQISEVKLILKLIRSVYEDCFIIIKLHPSTQKRFTRIFNETCKEVLKNFLIIDKITSDTFNMRLVLLSKAIIQKQSTVGFIAMVLGQPIISYNLIDTGYYDNLYKHLDCSFHAESDEEFITSLHCLNSVDELARLRQRQEKACTNFCLRVNSPNQLIFEAIESNL